MEKIINNSFFSYDLERMNNFIIRHGEIAFSDAVYNGAFEEWSSSYIHPQDELRTTPGFETIQKAFVRAYC